MIVAVGFIFLFILIFSGVPIAIGMMLVGVVGFAVTTSGDASLALLGQVVYDTTLAYQLSVIPLFILMGNFINHSRMSDDLYAAANAFLGHRKGGLAMATIAACGGFSAVSGSSLATVATMSKVAMPQMRQYGYSPSLAAGSVAAGGTLGILIPPSVILILYGIVTENDIASLFAAGLVPGILGMLLYLAAVRYTTLRSPEAGPPGPRMGWHERLIFLVRIWPLLMLFSVILGGIYGGIFTPTEAAGVGAFGAFFITLIRRSLTLRILFNTLFETGKTTAVLFFILIGATIFSNFINIAGFPYVLSDFVSGLGLGPVEIIVALTLVYLLLGCVLEGISMLLLTIPVFYPLVVSAGIDPIWFGVFAVVVIEIGMITPPVGLNAFVLKSTIPDVALSQVFTGLVPFVVADFVRIGLLVAFPSLALFLVELFY